MAAFNIFVCFLGGMLFASIHGISFNITRSPYVPGVTSSVRMNCQVGSSGAQLSQLLLLQLEVSDRGNMVPVVTITPGQPPNIAEIGAAAHVNIDYQANQFQNIGDSYLIVDFPFPGQDVAGNYTCVASGLSNAGLLDKYTSSGSLVVGAVDLLPHFMTSYVVEIRNTIQALLVRKNALLAKAVDLQAQEQNLTQRLQDVDEEFANLTLTTSQLKNQAIDLQDILKDTETDLDQLISVRPAMKVAFHASVSTLGARTAELNKPLIFDRVLTNQGKGYDAFTGKFKAPVPGTYVITVSVEAGAGNRNSELSIKMGDRILQTMHMSDDTDYQESTTTTIVHAVAGSEITCEFTWLDGIPAYVGSSDPTTPYVSTFSGYILW